MKLLLLFTLIFSILLAARPSPLIPATWRLHRQSGPGTQ